MWFKVFKQLDIPVIIAFLPTLLIYSIILFFIGGAIYCWQINTTVAAVFVGISGYLYVRYWGLFVFSTTADISIFSSLKFTSLFQELLFLPWQLISPLIREFPFPFLGSILHQCFDAINRVFVYLLRLEVRFFDCVIATVQFPLIQAINGKGLLHNRYMKAWTTSPEEHDDTCVGQDIALHNPADDIDTSQEAQEEAILWLSQMPLDPPDSEALVSSLARISSSRPCGRFKKPIIAHANLVLEASFRKEISWTQTNTTINCVLVLGNVKFQSAVDQNSDSDHDIGGIPVPPSVAWAAQQLTINAPRADLDIVHPGEVPGRLLAAAAWLSPVKGTEDVEQKGERLEIQDRSQFIEPIRAMLERYIRNEEPLDNKVLVNLIHGMHAFIPRGNRDNASSTVSLPPFFYDNYDSPWPEDKAVLRALVTYALDLLLPKREKKLLVEQKMIVSVLDLLLSAGGGWWSRRLGLTTLPEN